MTPSDELDRHCQPTTLEDLRASARRLATHVDVVAEASLGRPDLPVELAEVLARRLQQLADGAASMSPDQRAVARGAIAYFLLTHDADEDLAGPQGLDDDRDVFNEACRRLGRDDLVIPG